MDEDKIISATEASRAFSDLLHRVCYGGESFVIKKGNRLMARIAPMAVEKPETSAQETPAEAPAAASVDESEFYKAWIEQVREAPVDAE